MCMLYTTTPDNSQLLVCMRIHAGIKLLYSYVQESKCDIMGMPPSVCDIHSGLLYVVFTVVLWCDNVGDLQWR